MKLLSISSTPFNLNSFGTAVASFGFRSLLISAAADNGLLSGYGASLALVGGYPTPDSGKLFIGDGTGWMFHIASRNAGSTSHLFSFTDSGRLGIGTTAPQAKLDIQKNTSVLTDEFAYAFKITDGSGDSGLLLGVSSGQHAAIIQSLDPGTSWATRPLLLMPNGGNVGIGTTTPQSRLDINGHVTFSLSTADPQVNVTGAAGANRVLSFDFPSLTSEQALIRILRNTNTTGARGIEIYRGDGSGGLQTLLSSSGNSFLNALCGGVGIGTATPTTTLDVAGSINSSSAYKLKGVDAPFVPVGGIIAWAKLITGTALPLPAGFVECNGGTATINGTPGVPLPNLNGNADNNKYFLRGSANPGASPASPQHNHTIAFQAISQAQAGSSFSVVTTITSPTGNNYAIPPYYEVVFIMRVS